MQEAANGNIGLDIEHDHMLAIFDGIEREAGADIGIAGGVDHHVYAAGGGERLQIAGDGKLTALDGAINGGGGVRLDDAPAIMAGKQGGIGGGGDIDFRHSAQAQTRHARQLDDEIGAHLASAGKAHGNGLALSGARLQVGDKRRDVLDHNLRFFFFDFFGSSRRLGAKTAWASFLPSSPGCLP